MSKLQRLAISDEGFIFDPETGNSYTVNTTALEILKMLKEGLSKEEILTELINQFDVEKEEAERDLIDFLEQLKVFEILE